MMRAVRGTKDLTPSDYAIFEKIVNASRKISLRYGFENFATPIFEYTEVFDRTLGETSDVVNKEMYTFIDRGGDSVTLRPEFTAGIMRSVTCGLTHKLPMRLFSYGPIFRHDRPQAGRQRQFHQINCEILGEDSSESDAEIIKLGADILQDLDLLKDSKLLVNSLGCTISRANFHIALKEYLLKYEDELSNDSKSRLHKNPMRILDSKNENDQKILESAPSIANSYTIESKKRFDDVLNMLSLFGVKFEINLNLVRGLDYYCHTAFEFTTDKLGAQSTIIGGGRYDGLAKIMSKHDFPAVGFAGGIERMMLMIAEEKYLNRTIAILSVGDDSISESYLLASKLRDHGLPVIVHQKGKIGKRIEKSVSSGAIVAIFIGENEIKTQRYKIKNLELGIEDELSFDEILSKVGPLFL